MYYRIPPTKPSLTGHSQKEFAYSWNRPQIKHNLRQTSSVWSREGKTCGIFWYDPKCHTPRLYSIPLPRWSILPKYATTPIVDCPKLDHSGIVKNTSTKHTYKVPQRSFANSIIWSIWSLARFVSLNYVGQTMNSKSTSMISHIAWIGQKPLHLPKHKPPPTWDFILPKEATQHQTFKSMSLNSSNVTLSHQTP